MIEKPVYNAYKDVVCSETGFSHHVKLFRDKINFSHVGTNQGTFSKVKYLNAITTRLKDSYIVFWRKCLMAVHYKNTPIQIY